MTGRPKNLTQSKLRAVCMTRHKNYKIPLLKIAIYFSNEAVMRLYIRYIYCISQIECPSKCPLVSTPIVTFYALRALLFCFLDVLCLLEISCLLGFSMQAGSPRDWGWQPQSLEG